MVTVVVINGAGTSGKDTFIDKFYEVCEEAGGKYVPLRFSSVDIVKTSAKLIGWDGEKDNKGRRFLSDLKDAMTRYNDAPFKYMENKVKFYSDFSKDTHSHYVLFFHVREPQEIQRMVESFNAVSLLVVRDNVLIDSFTNHADKNVYRYDYDYIVHNNGTFDDLKTYAKSFFYLLNKREGR